MSHKNTIAVVGARGYVGAELLPMLERHPGLELIYLGSRGLAGQPVVDHIPGLPDRGLRFSPADPRQAQQVKADAWVLALPNEASGPWLEVIHDHQPGTAVIDISADHRFNDAWVYGQPERFRDRLRGARRIANPGCYATGLQLAVAPLLDLLEGPPTAFGVSGYSGAGSSPNPRNDQEVLRDNLLPYKLVEHTHEQEVSHHLGRQVFFSPHVAPFFRGITLTVSMPLSQPMDKAALVHRYLKAYGEEPLVHWQDTCPEVKAVAGDHGVYLGGLEVDSRGRRAVVVATLDNLLKGAATQAMQNINLALGHEELTGILS